MVRKMCFKKVFLSGLLVAFVAPGFFSAAKAEEQICAIEDIMKDVIIHAVDRVGTSVVEIYKEKQKAKQQNTNNTSTESTTTQNSNSTSSSQNTTTTTETQSSGSNSNSDAPANEEFVEI